MHCVLWNSTASEDIRETEKHSSGIDHREDKAKRAKESKWKKGERWRQADNEVEKQRQTKTGRLRQSETKAKQRKWQNWWEEDRGCGHKLTLTFRKQAFLLSHGYLYTIKMAKGEMTIFFDSRLCIFWNSILLLLDKSIIILYIHTLLSFQLGIDGPFLVFTSVFPCLTNCESLQKIFENMFISIDGFPVCA